MSEGVVETNPLPLPHFLTQGGELMPYTHLDAIKSIRGDRIIPKKLVQLCRYNDGQCRFLVSTV